MPKTPTFKIYLIIRYFILSVYELTYLNFYNNASSDILLIIEKPTKKQNASEGQIY